jgi:O-antigen/teichoic acid export membrane protein
VPARSVRRSAAAESIASKWRREAHAVLPVAVLSQFFADLSILLATPVLDSADMGAFGICVKLAFLVGFFVALTQNMATPDIADALNRHEGGRGGLNHAASCMAASAATGLALLVCMTWGDQVLRLFGAEYVAAQQALVLLVGAQLVRAIFGPTSAVLTLVGERRVNLMLAVAALVVLAAGTAGLGTLFGIDGAAAAVLLATIFWSGASAYMLHRAKGVRVDLFSAFGKPA